MMQARWIILLTILIFFWAAALHAEQDQNSPQPGPVEETEENGPDEALKEQLRQRAQEYWNLKVNMELDKAYAFEHPDSIKDVSLTEYMRSTGRGFNWLDAEVRNVSIDGDSGLVQVMIRYRAAFIPLDKQPEKGFTGNVSGEWVYDDGQWYHVHKDRIGRMQEPGSMGEPADHSENEPQTDDGESTQDESGDQSR